jgi:hypothetical protein
MRGLNKNYILFLLAAIIPRLLTHTKILVRLANGFVFPQLRQMLQNIYSVLKSVKFYIGSFLETEWLWMVN